MISDNIQHHSVFQKHTVQQTVQNKPKQLVTCINSRSCLFQSMKENGRKPVEYYQYIILLSFVLDLCQVFNQRCLNQIESISHICKAVMSVA